MKIHIIPGNGAGDVQNCMWYPWVKNKLNNTEIIPNTMTIECVLQNMPDPLYARKTIWLPFMEKELKIGPNDIIIGHSSGAVAGIRYAESHKIFGLILVGAYASHLNDEIERKSGYFDDDWQWQKVRDNCTTNSIINIVQFGSKDDPFLPWEEQVKIADGLKADLKVFSDKGHFQHSTFPEIVSSVKAMIALSYKR